MKRVEHGIAAIGVSGKPKLFNDEEVEWLKQDLHARSLTKNCVVKGKRCEEVGRYLEEKRRGFTQERLKEYDIDWGSALVGDTYHKPMS